MATIRGFRKGLTMIEVLVSLTIFLVVLFAIYQLFDTSHATYASGTRKQDAQQQARLAMDEMVRTLRMAGYVAENFDVAVGNELAGTARLHVATTGALAIFGSVDDSGQSAAFLYCLNGNALLAKRGTDTANLVTYRCTEDNAPPAITTNVIADNVSLLRFTYFDENGAQLAGDLDGKTTGAALDLAPRVQRDAVRTIVITLQITEQVVKHLVGQTPRQADQVYTLTSTVRLRNLSNT